MPRPGSAAEEFATAGTHELAHEMMHRDERRSSTSKRGSRETEAEAVAFVICQGMYGNGLSVSQSHSALRR